MCRRLAQRTTASDYTQFLNPYLSQISKGNKSSMVWTFNYAEYLSVFHLCCKDLKIDLVPYQARHSGPSIDRAKNVRTQEEVRKRGGWLSRQSVARYEESGQTCSKLAETSRLSPTDLPSSRKVHGRDLPRPRIPRHTPALNRHQKGSYVADFFAGHGGVARAVRKIGFNAREWEILKGPEHDLCHPVVLSKVISDIHKGKLIAAMFAPPCSSFSPARDRTRVVRTKQYPWGLPKLPDYEQVKVDIGNKCFRTTLKLIRELDRQGCPWVLENPHSSKCWHIPALQRLSQRAHVHMRVVDFCQYRTPWRKRTRFLLGNIEEFDSLRLSNRFCDSTNGICTKSQKPHFHLTGSNRAGIPYTRIAQPYPAGLNHDLAYVLTTKFFVIPYQQQQQQQHF